MANVIPFHTPRSASTPAEPALRVGETHYGQLAILHAEGTLPVRRPSLDASKLEHQLDFIKTLREPRVELTLDTKAAELAALTRYQGNPSGEPWADAALHLPEMFNEARYKALSALGNVPDLMRTQHFLDKEVAETDRFARPIKELKPGASELKPRRGQSREQATESLSLRLSKQSLRNEKIRANLENRHSVHGLSALRIRRAHLADRVRADGRL